MRDLVESLLTLSRGDEGAGLDVGRHDLAAVAEEAVAGGQGRRRRQGCPSSTPARSGEIEATFDRDRILQVAGILLDNAVKYTPEGGNVTVRLAGGGRPRRPRGL